MKSNFKRAAGKKTRLSSATLSAFQPFAPCLTMNIQQLSTNIDQKLNALEQQLGHLQAQLPGAGDNREQLLNDMAALEQIKTKLQKSRNIMWEAHQLQTNSDQKRLQQKRWLGLGLCVVSGLGLVFLIIWMFSQ